MNIKELKLRATNRAILIYESITGKIFNIENMTDQYVYFYSVILANNPEVLLTFDEFIDELDNDTEALPYLMSWLTTTLEVKNSVQKKSLNQENL